MTARAMWKAMIRVGGAADPVPIKLYAAARGRPFSFHLLHEKDGERVEQRIVNPESGETVAPSDVRKGFEVSSGVFVLVDPDELKVAAPEPSRDITVHEYVPRGALEPVWLERPYYLGPDGASSEYFALAEALRATERAGIATFVMRGKRYAGALIELHGYLALITLRHEDEVVKAPKLPSSVTRAIDPKERALAEQLVASLEGQFEPDQYQSEYRERLKELIAAKASGKRIAKARPIERAPTEKSLAAALKASLAKGGAQPKAGSRPGLKKARKSHAAEEKQSA
jgi:DNA end-binding protein Ku